MQRNLGWAVALALGIGAFAAVAAIEAGDPEPAYAVVVKSRGPDVRQLQRAIGVSADGVFGSQTERALRRWQRSHGLVADGIAGPSTRAALGLGAGPVLKRRGGQGGARRSRSDRGGGVRALQRRIGVPPDGVFGPGTEAALKRWQEAHGLVADGIAGPQTRAELGLGPGPVLKPRGSDGRGRRALGARRRDQRGQPNRLHALPLGRRSPLVPGLGLRLLRVRLLRAARRRPAAPAPRFDRLHELRRSGAGPAHHYLREPQATSTWSSTAAASTRPLTGSSAPAGLPGSARRPASWFGIRRACSTAVRPRSARPRVPRAPRAASGRSAGRSSWRESPRPPARPPWTNACGPVRLRSW